MEEVRRCSHSIKSGQECHLQSETITFFDVKDTKSMLLDFLTAQGERQHCQIRYLRDALAILLRLTAQHLPAFMALKMRY